MASVSTYLSHKLLDHVYGNTPFVTAGTLYLALYSSPLNSDGSGGTELSGGGYSRVVITNNTNNFPDTSGRLKSNGVKITFPNPTAQWTVAGFAILDAATGGNVYQFGAVSAVFPVGAPPVVEIADLDITLS